MIKSEQIFRKVPIIISKWWDGDVKGWRAEIPDNWEEFKPEAYKNINFEDISHHFIHGVETHERDHLVFYTRQSAVQASKNAIESHLKGKAKIWFL